MASQPDVFTEARVCMVNSQIRPNKVTDSRILTAMRHIPRERFLPASLTPLAYVDEDIPLGNGRYMMEPMVLARLLQSALLQGNERVLVVAAGPGYGAAVLAACGCRVTALEEDPGPDRSGAGRPAVRSARGDTGNWSAGGRMAGECPL